MMLRKLITELLRIVEEQVNHMTKSVRIGASQVPPPRSNFGLPSGRGERLVAKGVLHSNLSTSRPIDARRSPFQTAPLQPLERRPLPRTLPPFDSSHPRTCPETAWLRLRFIASVLIMPSSIWRKVGAIGYTRGFCRYFLPPQKSTTWLVANQTRLRLGGWASGMMQVSREDLSRRLRLVIYQNEISPTSIRYERLLHISWRIPGITDLTPIYRTASTILLHYHAHADTINRNPSTVLDCIERIPYRSFIPPPNRKKNRKKKFCGVNRLQKN